MENRIWEIIAASIHGEELSQEEISTLQVWLDEISRTGMNTPGANFLCREQRWS